MKKIRNNKIATDMNGSRAVIARCLLCMLFIICLSGGAVVSAQEVKKKITPVDVDDKKPRQPILHYYDKHGNQLDEPVLFLAELDTATKAKAGPVYPLYNGVDVGLNFADAVLALAGQKHYSFDVWAAVSLHNWFFPVVEAGIGFADNKPEDGNYRYKAKPSPYFKVGINYNFLYKSNPDYQVYLGLRGAWSAFRYDITDINIAADYWSQISHPQILNQSAHALYGEVLLGIKVKIVKDFSLGWTGRYRILFNKSDASNSTPWFVPGYGTGSPLNITFSAIYTFKAPKRTKLKQFHLGN